MPAQYTDYDSAWKDILREYFPEAIQFFFAATAELIDWQRPCEFLDKEFQRIAPEAEIGKRYADQLVRVWRQDGAEVWLLLHLEVQGKPETDFEQRMFVYHLRIFDLFKRHPVSLAILCDDQQDWRPQCYEFSEPDTALTFRFATAKLLDYWQRWQALEQSRNPFAVVVITHLQAQRAKRQQAQRPKAERDYTQLKDLKFNLIRRLYERGFNRSEIINLFRFIDWSIMLPEGLDQTFWQELKAYEQETTMPYVTSVEQIGRQEGRQEEGRSLILRQLTRRFGAPPEALKSQIETLELNQLEQLAEDLLDFKALDDLDAWLTANQP